MGLQVEPIFGADEFEGALPPSAGQNIAFVGVPGTENVPTDAAQFVVVVHRLFSATQSRGGRAIVSYSLDPMKDAPNLFAVRRQEQLLTTAAPVNAASDPGQTDDGSTTTEQAPQALSNWGPAGHAPA